MHEYDGLGPEAFFSAHGFASTTTYDHVWDGGRYPPNAIQGAAYEFATGQRLASSDFEGGKAGAVKVLGKLGFDVQPRTTSHLIRARCRALASSVPSSHPSTWRSSSSPMPTTGQSKTLAQVDIVLDLTLQNVPVATT